jgi:excisionase family DNA binding protein
VKLAVPVGEAADLIGCSPSMLWKLIAQGDIAKAKVGRRTVIRVAELERFLANAETGHTAVDGSP